VTVSQIKERIKASNLARDAGWMMLGQGAGFVLQAVYFVIVARLLGVIEYGIFVGAFAFVNLVGRYATLGTGPVFLRYVSVDESRFAEYWGNMLVLTAIGGTVLTGVLHFAGTRFLNPFSAALVLMAALANCFGMQVMMCTAQIFQAVGRMRNTALLNLLTSLLRTLTAATMWLTMHHATARQWTIASTLVSFVGAGMGLGAVLFQFHTPVFSLKLLRRRLVEGFEFAFASSTTSAYNDLDKAMLSHFGLNAANGIYTLAYRAVDIATMPIVSLRDAAMPHIFRKGAASLVEAAHYTGRLWKRSFPIALATAASMFFLAPLVRIIAGNGFAEVVSAIRWLSLIPIFRSVHEIAGSALTGAGLQRYRTGTQIVAVAVNAGLNLWLIPAHGWRGSAWASLATDGLLGAMNWSVLRLLVLRAQEETLSSTLSV
jgi:O-antigen/teichoic acid export membrane protein